MILSRSRLIGAWHVVRASGAVLVLAGYCATTARAADGLDFVVPDNEGYGISECMKPGLGCGHTIADAWCEAHGHGHADAYGLSEDLTGATKISTADALQIAAGSVIIHCGE